MSTSLPDRPATVESDADFADPGIATTNVFDGWHPPLRPVKPLPRFKGLHILWYKCISYSSEQQAIFKVIVEMEDDMAELGPVLAVLKLVSTGYILLI